MSKWIANFQLKRLRVQGSGHQTSKTSTAIFHLRAADQALADQAPTTK